jgi:hypothetical protein
MMLGCRSAEVDFLKKAHDPKACVKPVRRMIMALAGTEVQVDLPDSRSILSSMRGLVQAPASEYITQSYDADAVSVAMRMHAAGL